MLSPPPPLLALLVAESFLGPPYQWSFHQCPPVAQVMPRFPELHPTLEDYPRKMERLAPKEFTIATGQITSRINIIITNNNNNNNNNTNNNSIDAERQKVFSNTNK